METTANSPEPIGTTSKRFAHRLLTIGENRLELFAVEVQEERERLLHAFLFLMGVSAFGLLAAMSLSAAIVVYLWAYSPVIVLLMLATVYGATSFYFFKRLTREMRDWHSFSATLDQLRKDRECLQHLLS